MFLLIKHRWMDWVLFLSWFSVKWPEFRSRAQSQQGWLLTGFSSVLPGNRELYFRYVERVRWENCTKSNVNHSSPWIYMTVQDLTTERKASGRYQGKKWFPVPTRQETWPLLPLIFNFLPILRHKNRSCSHQQIEPWSIKKDCHLLVSSTTAFLGKKESV